MTMVPPPEGVRSSADVQSRLERDFQETRARGALPAPDGSIGATMFDQPGSEDNSITVLLGRDKLQMAPAQSLVRIISRGDQRRYLGVVTAGPFAEPDSLRADSNILVTVATRGGDYLPSFHGRVQVTLMGEELADGTLSPPRLRPLPHSPVYRLDEKESMAVLKSAGDLRLGLAVGHEQLPVGIPSQMKSVLPRHTAILGTTGSGKSTTVAELICQAQAAGMAVVLLDVEGEYTHLHQPTTDARMRASLSERGLEPRGLPAGSMTLYHLVNRETANPDHPARQQFSLQFAHLSPYTIIEMLELNDPQSERFLYAYDLAKGVLRDTGTFPRGTASKEERDSDEQFLLQLDEFERGYPRMTLPLLLDVVTYCYSVVSKSEFRPFCKELKTPEGIDSLTKHVDKKSLQSASSWGKVRSVLWRLQRLKIFDQRSNEVQLLRHASLLKPGHLSVIDLSDSGMTELTNIVIADLLRGIQEAQENTYTEYEQQRGGGNEVAPPPRVLLIIEEAHEFLSAERIEKTPILYQQVARIAKRGRKRWLGLVFVTQLPQHLPRQIFGLVNSYILHKISDPQVASTLQKTISGIDAGLWNRLPGLAPGQAIVSFPHMTRPMLVSIDPAPGQLRLID